ncbi:hypothetical protein [Streptomyces antibioticus]
MPLNADRNRGRRGVHLFELRLHGLFPGARLPLEVEATIAA